MTIKYKNITIEKYLKLSDKEKKENAYCIKYSNGDMEWRVNGLFHREDGPALADCAEAPVPLGAGMNARHTTSFLISKY